MALILLVLMFVFLLRGGITKVVDWEIDMLVRISQRIKAFFVKRKAAHINTKENNMSDLIKKGLIWLTCIGVFFLVNALFVEYSIVRELANVTLAIAVVLVPAPLFCHLYTKFGDLKQELSDTRHDLRQKEYEYDKAVLDAKISKQELTDEYNKAQQELTDKFNKAQQELMYEYNKTQQELTDEHNKVQQELTDELKSAILYAQKVQKELDKHQTNLSRLLESNLTSMPWLAGMMADFITYDLEVEAKKLDWGSNIRRAQKVASIREIRAEAEAKIKEAREAYYELEYLRSLFPSIDDIIETDYRELDVGTEIPESDPARRYMSKEEWDKLSDAERDQLALDRYVESRKKSRWQIGRDYELAVAYEYMQKGYAVDTFGSYMQLEDLGRDLIARQNGMTLIIQCKYWSSSKTIHEKHIFQLYGTIVSYCIEHGVMPESVHGLFITSASLSKTAKKAAEILNITVAEHHKMVDFPRIKCNIGRDPNGITTKIYHLPMDFQYDQTRIDKPGEFYAFTVAEAQAQGFRRAYRWHGSAGSET